MVGGAPLLSTAALPIPPLSRLPELGRAPTAQPAGLTVSAPYGSARHTASDRCLLCSSRTERGGCRRRPRTKKDPPTTGKYMADEREWGAAMGSVHDRPPSGLAQRSQASGKRFGSEDSVGYFKFKPFHVLAAHPLHQSISMPTMPVQFSWAGCTGAVLHANRKADMSSERCGISRGSDACEGCMHAGAKPRAIDAPIHQRPWRQTGLPAYQPANLRRGKQTRQMNHSARWIMCLFKPPNSQGVV